MMVPWGCRWCGQLNSEWAEQCGRCDHDREPHQGCLPCDPHVFASHVLTCQACGGYAWGLHMPGEYEIETHGGRYIDLFMPRAESVDIVDVAWALARTCRFGGHCARHYSVAEHAVLVADKVLDDSGDARSALAALHHDDAEAYLGDIPRPLKNLIRRMRTDEGVSWRTVETTMDRTIAQALAARVNGAPWLWNWKAFGAPTVKAADSWACLLEAQHLLPSRAEGWTLGQWDLANPPWPLDPPVGWEGGLHDHAAANLWLTRHRQLVDAVLAVE